MDDKKRNISELLAKRRMLARVPGRFFYIIFFIPAIFFFVIPDPFWRLGVFIICEFILLSIYVKYHLIRLDNLFSLSFEGKQNWYLSVKLKLPFTNTPDPVNELYKRVEEILAILNSVLPPGSSVSFKTWIVPQKISKYFHDKYPFLSSTKIKKVYICPLERIGVFFFASKTKGKTFSLKTARKILFNPWYKLTLYINNEKRPKFRPKC